MRVKAIIDEDFINYKEPSMFIGCISCGGKCAKDGGFDISVCQNNDWRDAKVVDVDTEQLVRRYCENGISRAVVFGLLEPFEQFDEMTDFIRIMRFKYKCDDPVVIYTGYNEEEISEQVKILRKCFKNIIIKYGRFVLGDKKHLDETLGVFLASNNQYAERIS